MLLLAVVAQWNNCVVDSIIPLKTNYDPVKDRHVKWEPSLILNNAFYSTSPTKVSEIYMDIVFCAYSGCNPSSGIDFTMFPAKAML